MKTFAVVLFLIFLIPYLGGWLAYLGAGEDLRDWCEKHGSHWHHDALTIGLIVSMILMAIVAIP